MDNPNTFGMFIHDSVLGPPRNQWPILHRPRSSTRAILSKEVRKSGSLFCIVVYPNGRSIDITCHFEILETREKSLSLLHSKLSSIVEIYS